MPKSHPDYVAIETLLTVDAPLKLVNKCPNSKEYCFRPDDYITRGELSKIIRDVLDR